MTSRRAEWVRPYQHLEELTRPAMAHGDFVTPEKTSIAALHQVILRTVPGMHRRHHASESKLPRGGPSLLPPHRCAVLFLSLLHRRALMEARPSLPSGHDWAIRERRRVRHDLKLGQGASPRASGARVRYASWPIPAAATAISRNSYRGEERADKGAHKPVKGKGRRARHKGWHAGPRRRRLESSRAERRKGRSGPKLGSEAQLRLLPFFFFFLCFHFPILSYFEFQIQNLHLSSIFVGHLYSD
jgi:hypothetical protein